MKHKSAAIPIDIYEACEAEARRRRKHTGDSIAWTTVLYEILRKSLNLQHQQ